MLEQPNKRIETLDKSYPVIVFGGAQTFMEEWEEFAPILHEAVGDQYYFAAVNNQIQRMNCRVEFYFTLHTEKSDSWILKRENSGLNMDFVYVGHRRRKQDEYSVDFEFRDSPQGSCGGSSGGYAPAVLIRHFGFDKVVVVGVPMTNKANYFRQEKSWQYFNKYLKGWNRHYETFLGKVKSTSGWTMEQHGYPTLEWLKGEEMAEEHTGFEHGQVLEQEPMRTLESIGRDQLDNLFLIPDIENNSEQFVLRSKISGKSRQMVLGVHHSEKYLYIDNDGQIRGKWDTQPTKREIKEHLEGADETEEQSTTEESEQTEAVEQSTQTEAETVTDRNSVKKESDNVDRDIEDWFSYRGNQLMADGHAPRNIVSTFMRDQGKQGRYKDVVRYIGPDRFRQMEYRQIFRKALELE